MSEARDRDVGKGKDGCRMDGWMQGDRIGDDVGDGVRGDGVCLGRGVGGRGRVTRLEVIGGREIFGKEGKGDRGFAENSGAWILKRGKGKQNGSGCGESCETDTHSMRHVQR